MTLHEGITEIGGYAFYQCTSLESIVLPESLKTLGQETFEKSALTSIDIPDQVTMIPKWCFKDCEGLRKASIGKDVTMVQARAFDRCPLVTIYSYNPEPPMIGVYAFYNSSATVYVPEESVELYKNHNVDGWGWHSFNTILPIEASKNDDISDNASKASVIINGTVLSIVDADGMSAQIFGVDGRCEWQTASYGGEAVGLQPGIHIVRVGDNTLKVSL